MKIKDRGIYIVLLSMILIAEVIGGGYFVFVSSFMNVIGGISVFFLLLRAKKIYISKSMTSISISLFVFMYFIVCLWAVDRGTAFMGAMKFFPVAVFLFLICQKEEERENLIALLPLLGSLMTIFSFVMMQFEIFKPSVTVAGRLAGFFQYPNTYAVFMLVCLLISIFRLNFKQLDWLEILYIIVEIFGIYMSGSRTVFVLTIFSLILVLAARKEKLKMLLGIFLVFGVIAGILFFTEDGRELVLRISGMSTGFSTFFGRILYVQDAVKLILKHPLGLGYYGYYFMQQEIQTGVYSVVNAHNELIQAMLDIGIIPGIFLYIGIVKSIFSSRTEARNKIVLTVLLLHSLFDYDLQFLIMWYVLILFIDLGTIKEYKISGLTKTVSAIVGAAVIGCAVSVGLSDLFYIINDFSKAEQMYEGNTLAKIDSLSEIESVEELQEKADEILKENEHVAIAYSAKARALFSQGEVEGFIKNKLTALQMAPYQYEEYTDYLDTLAYCEGEYIQKKDMDSAKSCLLRAEQVPGMLETVKKKTSMLGWKIKDRPEVTLSQEYFDLIDEMREKINEKE
jgi:O-antigen ligase